MAVMNCTKTSIVIVNQDSVVYKDYNMMHSEDWLAVTNN